MIINEYAGGEAYNMYFDEYGEITRDDKHQFTLNSPLFLCAKSFMVLLEKGMLLNLLLILEMKLMMMKMKLMMMLKLSRYCCKE